MSINPNMANREVCDVIFVDYKTQVPFLNLDYANTSALELTGEPVFAYGGKGHPKRVSFSGDKGGTISFETQIQSFQLYSLMSGGEIETSANFLKRVEKTAASGVITLDKAPVAGSVNVFAAGDDCGTALEVTVDEKAVTLKDNTSNGDYIVYYMEALTENTKKISIKTTTFPKNFTAYMETFNKTENDEIVPYNMIAYKCAPQPNMSFNFTSTGDPSTLTITCDLLADQEDRIIDLILIEDPQ